MNKKMISAGFYARSNGMIRKRICAIAFLFAGLLLYSSNVYSQRVSVATNLLGYLNFGTLNAHVELGLSQHLSLYIQGKYNPFEFKYDHKRKQINNRQAAIAFGSKYWLWHNHSGWYFSGQMGYVNFNRGGIISQDTYEGNAYGITLGAGYALMISRRINIDFGAGIMGGYTDYIKYACPSCGRVVGADKKMFIAPNNVMAQLSYIF